MVERDCNCGYIRGYHKMKDCSPLRREERRKDNLASRRIAFSLVEEFRKTGDLKKLLVEVSDFGQWFGRFNKYNRRLFEGFLVEALDNSENGLTAQPVKITEEIGRLHKWIEERSLDLPDENDAKDALFKIAEARA